MATMRSAKMCVCALLEWGDRGKRIGALIRVARTGTPHTRAHCLQNKMRRLNLTHDVLIHSVALFDLIWLKLHLWPDYCVYPPWSLWLSQRQHSCVRQVLVSIQLLSKFYKVSILYFLFLVTKQHKIGGNIKIYKGIYVFTYVCVK